MALNLKIKKNIYKIIIALYFIFIFLFPIVYHSIYYWLIPGLSCSHYSAWSPSSIMEKFDKESTYTKLIAAEFFTHCATKNAAPFILSSLEYDYTDLSNPFWGIDFLTQDMRPINTINRQLSSVLGIRRLESKEQSSDMQTMAQTYNYWAPIIKKQTGHELELTKTIKETKGFIKTVVD